MSYVSFDSRLKDFAYRTQPSNTVEKIGFFLTLTSILHAALASTIDSTNLPSTRSSWTAATVISTLYLGYRFWLNPVDPSKVASIYAPQRLELGTEELASKVEQLRQNPIVLGLVRLPVAQKGSCLAYIQRVERIEDGSVTFSAKDLTTGQAIGFALVRPFLESNNYQKEHYIYSYPEDMIGYGFDNNPCNKVCIEQITNMSPNKSCRNIGYSLIKAIIQYYQESCGGRVVLDAVRNTHPFYYKLGFRIADPSASALNGAIAYRTQSRNIDRADFGRHLMFLPDDAQALWRQEIAIHPISF